MWNNKIFCESIYTGKINTDKTKMEESNGSKNIDRI